MGQLPASFGVRRKQGSSDAARFPVFSCKSIFMICRINMVIPKVCRTIFVVRQLSSHTFPIIMYEHWNWDAVFSRILEENPLCVLCRLRPVSVYEFGRARSTLFGGYVWQGYEAAVRFKIPFSTGIDKQSLDSSDGGNNIIKSINKYCATSHGCRIAASITAQTWKWMRRLASVQDVQNRISARMKSLRLSST